MLPKSLELCGLEVQKATQMDETAKIVAKQAELWGLYFDIIKI